MTTPTTWKNVVRGVAIGDAWGDPVEFRQIADITRANYRGPELPEKLRITDDTQMTLYLADALDVARDGAVDEVKAAIQEAFLAYHSDPDAPSRAPGVTVMGSLGRLSRGTPWQEATNPTSDGSGTVMRTSPVAFTTDDRWVGIAAFAAAVTHGASNAIAAAILNVAVLRAMLAGRVTPGNATDTARLMAADPAGHGLLEVGEWLDGYEVDLTQGFAELTRLLDVAVGALPELTDDPWHLDNDPSLLIGGGGWRSHETLVIALLAADMFPADPWEALRRAAVTNGDSDTIAAVAGGLLGALHPQAFISRWDELRERFEPRYREWIENEADDYVFAPTRSWSLSRVLRLLTSR